jgi:hypothetical protein
MVKYQIEGRGRRSRNRMVVGFTTTPMQSVPVTTNKILKFEQILKLTIESGEIL